MHFDDSVYSLCSSSVVARIRVVSSGADSYGLGFGDRFNPDNPLRYMGRATKKNRTLSRKRKADIVNELLISVSFAVLDDVFWIVFLVIQNFKTCHSVGQGDAFITLAPEIRRSSIAWFVVPSQDPIRWVNT